MRPWRWEIFGEWLKTGFVWAVPLALNLRALTRLNPETLIVFRTATLIGVTFGDHAYGKRFSGARLRPSSSSRRVCLHAWYDAQYDAEGYAWATLYWFAMVVSMLYVKHSFSVHKDLSIWDKTTYLNATAAAAGALLAALRVHVVRVRGALARGRDVVARELSHGGGAGVRVEQEPGFFISHRSTSCPRRKGFTILASSLAFESAYTPQSLVGLLVALAGGSLYSPVGTWCLRCAGFRDAGAGAGAPGGDFGGVGSANQGRPKGVTWAGGVGGGDEERKGRP